MFMHVLFNIVCELTVYHISLNVWLSALLLLLVLIVLLRLVLPSMALFNPCCSCCCCGSRCCCFVIIVIELASLALVALVSSGVDVYVGALSS